MTLFEPLYRNDFQLLRGEARLDALNAMAMTSEDFTVLYGGNAVYIADLYEKYLGDPSSVDGSWQEIFAELGDTAAEFRKERTGASWAPNDANVVATNGGNGNGAAVHAFADSSSPAISSGLASAPIGGYGVPAAPINADAVRQATLASIQALMLIRAYRVRGHFHADLDPLGLEIAKEHPELDYRNYGFTESDLDRPIFINYVLGLEVATLRQIIDICNTTYCGTIGVEFMHIQEPDRKAWIQERIESRRNHTDFTERGKKAILERLTAAETFEQFLDKKFTGTKRFGVDGGESLVPALEQILKRGGQLGLREVVIGMAHRGRLNILANFMAKPFAAIFSEFQGNAAKPDDVQGSGDVKYHLGTSADREFDGTTVHLSLTANPSHLECVNTVVLGKVRAKQRQLGDEERTQVMGLLLHGDAAFAGQGLVAETFDLSELKGYRTGGTIHFVINNQIGFTTAPAYSRSSPYCSDIAKKVGAPIFHVNGDDPEAVVHVARIATEYRQTFKSDVVIDMFCYRRYGHNEGDEPAFTQPLMYKKIAKHPTTRQLYADRLAEEGTIGKAEGEEIKQSWMTQLDDAFEAAKTYRPNNADWLEGRWSGIELAPNDERRGITAVSHDLLREVGVKISEPPQNFNLHRKIQRQLEAKRKMIDAGEGIDWATAEALAYGTLLLEGTPVRLSGQDCGRGTFSQRHSVLVDQENEDRFLPLNNIRFGQAPYEVIDSNLSEAGVLGFEYGYSMAEPHMLVMWEAQFGDFANGAQVIIDQFISSAESKWLRMSGLVMLLPHGYEGQGPEHSSARLERYLQLCAEDNMQVANCTTPANYFHILRRQVRRPFRKPLILMTPKSLLRHKLCVSKMSEMATGSTFHRVLWDDGDPNLGGSLPEDNKKIKRVVLCTGKVYFDLFEEREKRGLKDVYIMRVEQPYPFPFHVMKQEMARFAHAEIVWCQEEPKNMGAWTFIAPRIEQVLGDVDAKSKKPIYAGRAEAASPATGLASQHKIEQQTLVDQALTVGFTG